MSEIARMGFRRAVQLHNPVVKYRCAIHAYSRLQHRGIRSDSSGECAGVGANVTVTYSGTLQSAAFAEGPYADVVGQSTDFMVALTTLRPAHRQEEVLSRKAVSAAGPHGDSSRR